MRTKHALVVDDDERWFRVCKMLCDDFGYTCTWAPDPVAARSEMKTGSYDLLILDLCFPDPQEGLFPPDVDSLELLLVSLISNSRLPLLVCTGITDRAKLALVRERLAASRRKAYLFRKGDDLQDLYCGFRLITDTTPDAPKGGGLVPALGAFFGLLVLHFALLTSLFLAPHYLPKDSAPALVYFLMALIAFTGAVSTVLIFWMVHAITGSDATQLLRVATTSFLAAPRHSGGHAAVARGRVARRK